MKERKEHEQGMSQMMFLTKDVFSVILELEGQLERFKIDLARRRDFTIQGAYFLFSNSPQYKLSLEEYKFGLNRLNINSDPRYITLVFSRYDQDQDGKLGIWEFTNQLLPIDHGVRDEVEQRESAYELTFETKELLVNVFRKCIDVEVEVEMIRQRLNHQLAIPLRGAYDQLDWLNRGFLTKAEIKRIIDQNIDMCPNRSELRMNSHLDSLEMEALFRRFNKDKVNGKISMVEFIDELTPKML